jgi:ribosomal protein S18 acetylase RimI-like enzyme
MNILQHDTLIRKAVIEDVSLITDFQLSMAFETEGILLDKATTEKGVQAIFNDPSKGTYYIAETGSVPAGSLLTTPEWSDWRNRTILWIQSVYVIPEYRGKGVFTALYRRLLEIAESDPNIGGIRLYVDKTNLIAQKVYSRMGMDGQHYQVFEWMK